MAAERPPHTRYMATVGMFDGVHLGHVDALRQFCSLAAARGLRPLVVTFDRHPLAAIAPHRTPALLTRTDTRRALIHAACPDAEVLVLPASDGILGLTAEGFLQRLNSEHGVDAFAMGYNNHIGCDRADADTLRRNAPIPVVGMKALDDIPVSSTRIRQALCAGDVAAAAAMLGRPYSISGTVVHGRQLGRTIGFPTANIAMDDAETLIPAPGVYAADIIVDSDAIPHRAMLNIGRRPTVEDDVSSPVTVEAHIIGYDADLYGRRLDVSFLSRLRDERRFASLEDLRRQLVRDRQAASITPPLNTTAK